MTNVTDPAFLRGKDWQLLHIPAARVGDFEIVHDDRDPGALFPTSNLRAQLVGGQANIPLVFTDQSRWHQLLEHGTNDKGEPTTGTWMTDYPMEQLQLDRHLPDMHGSVLLGGLGLGYAATQLAREDAVLEIVCVEISEEVIELVAANTTHNGKMRVVHDDLANYLAECGRTFDTAFYDTWAPDSLGTFFEEVMPLREASADIVTGPIACWNEDVMRGQLNTSLTARMMMIDTRLPKLHEDQPRPTAELFATPRPAGEDGAIYWDWQVPFFCKMADGGIDFTDVEAARFYADVYGMSGWEAQWNNYKSG